MYLDHPDSSSEFLSLLYHNITKFLTILVTSLLSLIDNGRLVRALYINFQTDYLHHQHYNCTTSILRIPQQSIATHWKNLLLKVRKTFLRFHMYSMLLCLKCFWRCMIDTLSFPSDLKFGRWQPAKFQSNVRILIPNLIGLSFCEILHKASHRYWNGCKCIRIEDTNISSKLKKKVHVPQVFICTFLHFCYACNGIFCRNYVNIMPTDALAPTDHQSLLWICKLGRYLISWA